MRKREEIESDYVEGKVSKNDLTFEVMLDIRDVLTDLFLEYVDDKYESEFCDDENCPECHQRKVELGLIDEEDIVIEELNDKIIDDLCVANGICLEEKKSNEK